jgi:large subunit ribosomal protein L35Ae
LDEDDTPNSQITFPTLQILRFLSPPLAFEYSSKPVIFPLGRLYSKGRVLGHKRAKRNSRPNTSLIQIEGVATKEDAQFYLGKVCRYISNNKEMFAYLFPKRVAFVYKAKREVQGSKIRVIWGCVEILFLPMQASFNFFLLSCRRVTRPHGSSGVVKSKFRSNLPPRAFGASVRVVCYSFAPIYSNFPHAIDRCFTHPTFNHVCTCTCSLSRMPYCNMT